VPTFIRPLCFSPSIGLDDGVKKTNATPYPKHIIFTQHNIFIYLFIYFYLYSCHHTNMSQNIGYPLGGAGVGELGLCTE
jgi:hypothetical protein